MNVNEEYIKIKFGYLKLQLLFKCKNKFLMNILLIVKKIYINFQIIIVGCHISSNFNILINTYASIFGLDILI